MAIEYYVIKREKHSQGIATAALWHCWRCGECISGMGGPGSPDIICIKCGDQILQENREFSE